ncbi:MAG: copper amine oxidase [Ruminococcaceae bacterium]|nr:copper amine oxidase [Oscillospiraceae bacterium]
MNVFCIIKRKGDNMTLSRKIGLSILIAILMMLSVLTVFTQAKEIDRNDLKYFISIEDKNVQSYHSVDLYLGNKYINEKAYLIKDTTYVPLRTVSTLAGAGVAFDDKSRTAYITMQGFSMTVSEGGYIIMANERPIMSYAPAVILSDNRMYVPVRSIAKALSLGVEWNPNRRVNLSGTPKPLIHADRYYNKDDVYWLSRIISAESRGEPLLGQVAVGNVVLNRMRHKDYPNTIYSVIFDRKYGIQFSPVANGSIYSAPSYNSVLAAKVCLEGVSVSEKILFFMEPNKSTSSWIYKNRPYAFSIGNHYFFY